MFLPSQHHCHLYENFKSEIVFTDTQETITTTKQNQIHVKNKIYATKTRVLSHLHRSIFNM